jgi:subtilisin family serine protease
MMKKLHILARASLLILFLAVHSFADDRFIVRVPPSLVDYLTKTFGVKFEKELNKADGVYLVSLPKNSFTNALVQWLKNSPLIQGIEPNHTLVLPELTAGFDRSNRKIPVLKGGAPKLSIPGNPWIAYVNQPANGIIRIAEAHKKYGQGSGAVTVALIDTGIDASHPALLGAVDVWRGRNFISNNGDVGVSQETTPFVDQETTPFVDGSGAIVLNQETTPFVDQETTPFVDGSRKVPKAWYHATAVASIIRLVAPNVRIMPLKAFNSDGSGTMADVIEAIYWAVDHGADVINMSFSAESTSDELDKAIRYANSRNVICVASAGNGGSKAATYPAALSKVIAVGATTNDDYRAAFSNYGSTLDIGAPGVQIIAAYPRGRWAVVTGTSFSDPYVTGTVALIRSLQRRESADESDEALSEAAATVINGGLGAGRLDVFQTLRKLD